MIYNEEEQKQLEPWYLAWKITEVIKKVAN